MTIEDMLSGLVQLHELLPESIVLAVVVAVLVIALDGVI